MSETQNNVAFEILKEIERRSIENASLVPRQEQSDRFWTGVGFRLNGVEYVAPLKEVAEILTVPNFTKVPGAKAWVKGLANIRGNLLPIMDLHGYFGRKAPMSLRRQRVLVVNHEGVQSGVIVDDVLGLQHFEDNDRLETSADHEERLLPYIQGEFERGEQTWPVFSLFALAEHADFRHVAI